MTDRAAQSAIISINIKRLRDSWGLTQAELARKATITPAALSKIESGDGRVPTMVVLRKLAGALGVSVDEITGERPVAAISPQDEKVVSFYRRFETLANLDEEDQKRLLELAERLKGISKSDD